MASINGVSSNSTSSIYGNRNVISGLASGIDTESLIENAVSGIKLKVSQLEQKRTKKVWEQTALRSIIDKMANFTQKYTSYASSTNLLSGSFFNNAVKVNTVGNNADKISASGRTSSNIQVLGVKQLATSARYTLDGLAFRGNGAEAAISGDAVRLDEDYKSSATNGTLSIAYGGNRTINLSFDDTVYNNAQEFKDAIVEKLSEIDVTKSNGETVKANTMIDVKMDDDGVIRFSDKQGAGNSVYVKAAAGDLKDTFGVDSNAKADFIRVKSDDQLYNTDKRSEVLSEQELTFTLDGVTKTIKMPKLEENSKPEDVVSGLQKELDKAFGTGKIKVANKAEDSGQLQLNFETQKGSTMGISGDATKVMGLDKFASTYLDVGKKLGDLLDENIWDDMDKLAAEGKVTAVKNGEEISHYVDEKGNRVAADEAGNYFRVDDKGDFLYDFKINDVSVGNYSKNTALETVMLGVNNNSEAGVKVTYSKTTNQFQFEATDSGTAGKVEFGDGLAQVLFGNGTAKAEGKDAKGQSTAGQDAIFSMTVNGKEYKDITRSSNSFDVDGLTMKLKGSFGYEGDNLKTSAGSEDAVTFEAYSDSDKIVDAIKSFVTDYNEMVTEIKNAYSTMPAERSNHSRYEPLTDEDKEGMSESTIKEYEEKAKQGILFADRDLRSLYEQLTQSISNGGKDGAALREMGISTSYSDGLTTLSLDEDALRSALESDPDGVKEAFTKTVSNGAKSDGLVQSLKTTLDRFGSVTGTKGTLVDRAGSVKAPATLNDNTIQKLLDNFDTQIEKWETKLTDQIDRYSRQFTQLEKLINEMNSQSSALAGFMGNSY